MIGQARWSVGGPHIKPFLGRGTNGEACCLLNFGLSEIENETVKVSLHLEYAHMYISNRSSKYVVDQTFDVGV